MYSPDDVPNVGYLPKASDDVVVAQMDGKDAVKGFEEPAGLSDGRIGAYLRRTYMTMPTRILKYGASFPEFNQ